MPRDRGYARRAMADDPELTAMLDALSELLEAMRRLSLLAERLAARASLNPDETRDVQHEIETTRNGVDKIDAMLTLRRQHLRPI